MVCFTQCTLFFHYICFLLAVFYIFLVIVWLKKKRRRKKELYSILTIKGYGRYRTPYFWSKGYALMPSATKTIDMALPSFIKQVLLLNSFPCLFLYSYLCKLHKTFYTFWLYTERWRGNGQDKYL